MTTAPVGPPTAPRLAHLGLVAVLTAPLLTVVLGAFTIGVFAVPVALAAGAALAVELVRARVAPAALGGVLVGLAVLPGWFAYLAGGHPGISDGVVTAGGLPSPWWSGALAAALVAGGLLVFAAARRGIPGAGRR